MASNQQNDVVLEAPNTGRIRELASTVLATLRAAQGQLQDESNELLTHRERLTADQAKIGRSQEELAQLHQDVESKFAELAVAGKKLNDLRAEVEAARKQLDVERLALCGDRVRNSPPEVEAQEAEAPREEILGRCDPAVPPTTDHPHEPVPKPASSNAAQQFRKLRRDAKRKAIGV